MPILNERRIIELGKSSYVVCIPKGWFRYHRLNPGDMVEVIVNDEVTIRCKAASESNGTAERRAAMADRKENSPVRGSSRMNITAVTSRQNTGVNREL